MANSLKLVLLGGLAEKGSVIKRDGSSIYVITEYFQWDISVYGELDSICVEINMCEFGEAFNEISLRIKSK